MNQFDRFLRYSHEHQRAIRMIFMTDEGAMRQVNAIVEQYDAKQITLYIVRPIQRVTLSPDQILSADYARGDEGQD